MKRSNHYSLFVLYLLAVSILLQMVSPYVATADTTGVAPHRPETAVESPSLTDESIITLEPPYTPPPAQTQAVLQVWVDEVTTTASLGQTIPLSVHLVNSGTAPAREITITAAGGSYFEVPAQYLDELAAGAQVDVSLSLQMKGYSLGDNSLLVTVSASNLVNPVQAQAKLTVSASQTDVSHRFLVTDTGEFGAAFLGQVAILGEQQVTAEQLRSQVLHFQWQSEAGRETAETAGVQINLSDLLGTATATETDIHLSYQAEDSIESTPVPFTYDTNTFQLSFTPAGTGDYYLWLGWSPEDGSDPNWPSWKPQFNDPVVSPFQGTVSYNYPIESPPGPGGFQPQLALVYSSGASHGVQGMPQSGPYGWGWSLAGTVEIAQKVKICNWSGHSVCPVDAHWEGDGFVHPGILRFTLSIGGTGYDLIHENGETQNGYPGRYYVEGSAGIYVEYCRFSGTQVCLAEDTGDSTVNGAADTPGQLTRGFWVVKTADNQTYVLGYSASSEQELVNSIEMGNMMGPWASATPYAHALQWRADKGRDRFGNLIQYTYAEYWPSDVNATWSNAQIHAKASYLTQIDYGFNRIIFTYAGNNGFGAAYGQPPYDWYVDADIITWQTHHLTTITVQAQDYQTPNGTYQTVRTYQLTHLALKHGTPGSGAPNPANQTAWCADPNYNSDNLMGLVDMLASITEYDGQVPPQPLSLNSANVEFQYQFRQTGTNTFFGNTDFKYCYPYLVNLYTAYGPPNDSNGNRVPTATFDYYAEETVSFPDNQPDSGRWAQVVWQKTVRSGWSPDAPNMVSQFEYGPFDFHGDWDPATFQTVYDFNGTSQATRLVLDAAGAVHHKEKSYFLLYEWDEANSTLNGKIDLQETLAADNTVLQQSDDTWAILDDFTTGNLAQQPIVTKRVTSDLTHFIYSRTDYQYNSYGNQTEVRQFGDDLVGSTPIRTQETLYLANASADDDTGTIWLVNLPWRATVWDGLPSADVNKIVSRQRMRYDNATCAAPSAIPTSGLLTNQDIYLPGSTGACGADWLTTDYFYGGVGGGSGAWWQLTRVEDPMDRWNNIYWQNHTVVDKTETSAGYTDSTYDDPYTPWLVSSVTQPNGATTDYIYDSFGRLTEGQTPNAATGAADVVSIRFEYDDEAKPLTINEITAPDSATPVTVRTFYDAVGRPLQQRSWGFSSDFNYVVTDTEYDALGQVVCQTAPIPGSENTFNSGLSCLANDRTTSTYNVLGQAVTTTGLDGVANYGLALGLTGVTLNGEEQLGIQTADELGRLASVEEFNTLYDAFEAGPFDNDPTKWSLNSSRTDLETLNGESVLKVWANAPWEGQHAKRQTYSVSPGGGVFFRFRLADTNHAGRIGLATSAGGFIGLALFGQTIYPDYNIDGSDIPISQVAINQQANGWYRAEMSIDPPRVGSPGGCGVKMRLAT